jgi:hypothetical protein
MRRFVLRQNVVRFERALAAERDETGRGPIRAMLAASRRELALLEAKQVGAEAAPVRASTEQAWREHQNSTTFRSDFDRSPHPCMVLDPGPGLRIIDLNAAHRVATHTGRDAIGRPLFDAFPDDPANAGSESVRRAPRRRRIRAAADRRAVSL